MHINSVDAAVSSEEVVDAHPIANKVAKTRPTMTPDGFGFQPPRIIVEVKHRKGTTGAPEVRSFVGGLRQNDNGLCVSTGGFTREARYEADRSNQNLTLMGADDPGKAIVEHYDRMDSEARALLPPKKINWPV